MIEVLNKSVREEEVNASLFNHLFEKIGELDEIDKLPADYLLNFLVGLSVHLGFHPDGSFSITTPFFSLSEGRFMNGEKMLPNTLNEKTSEHLSLLIHAPSSEISPISRKLLLEALLQYYQLHIPNFSRPKSLRVLEEVFRN
jgi:DNA repair protein RecO (recombination protein O)